MEKGIAKMPFEFSDTLGHRRLRDTNRIRCPGEGTKLINRDGMLEARIEHGHAPQE